MNKKQDRQLKEIVENIEKCNKKAEEVNKKLQLLIEDYIVKAEISKREIGGNDNA